MLSHASAESKKTTKRSVKHTKTGCRSCKIRRIKCDERRPVCVRCLTFGVECDGYAPVVPAPKPLSSARPLLPRLPVGKLLQSSLCLTPFKSDLEARYFDSFCNKIVHRVLPYCQCTLHSPMIWGASWHASIRHAFVALAALYEASVASTALPELSTDSRKAHYRMAIEHYSKSIELMSNAMVKGEQNLQTTLITCFVIFGFEAFVGEIDGAVTQLQTGIALIEDWQQDRNSAQSQDPTLNEVVACFLTLEVQLPENRDSRSVKRHKILRAESTVAIRNMPRNFTTGTEAERYLQLVRKRVRHFLQIGKSFASPTHNVSNDEAQEIVFYRAQHEAELDQWSAAFQPLFAIMHVEADIDSFLSSSLMRLQHFTTYVMLKTELVNHGMIYDQYAPEFAEMVSLCFKILRTMAIQGKTPKFSFDLIVIPSMYLVGMKCRIGTIRQRAIDVLLSLPRREGIWDGILHGKIAEWVRTIEEEFAADNGVIPAWARVDDIQSSVHLQTRCAMLSCLQRLGDRLNVRERRISLTW